jgi:ParB/Sulfiredoxin domain
VIEQIAAQLNGEFDPAHALIVRPNAAGFEIVSGHHRKLAAERAGITELPCWVREMSDQDAYMALALCNAQGELHPLEIGLHALRSGLPLLQYAKRAGISGDNERRYLAMKLNAAQVATAVGTHVPTDRWRHLAEIHAAPEWLWQALVSAMLAGKWSVERARHHRKVPVASCFSELWPCRCLANSAVRHGVSLRWQPLRRAAVLLSLRDPVFLTSRRPDFSCCIRIQGTDPKPHNQIRPCRLP